MTSTIQRKGRSVQSSAMGKPANAASQRPGKLKANPSQRRTSASAPIKGKSVRSTQAGSKPFGEPAALPADDTEGRVTAIEQCVQNELRRYFEMLDGEEPANLYRMVIRQTEHAMISMVMDECRGNQTRASEWLGISRGNLRAKLASMEK